MNAELYPSIHPTKGYTDARAVMASVRQNRQNFKTVDDLKQKCLNFTHGVQFDPQTEAERTQAGLPSIVADRTLGVFKTLDGYARKSRINVDLSPLGNDDYEGAKMRTSLLSAERSLISLQARQAEAYGMAAITGEAYLLFYPEKNVMGQLEPCPYVLMAFEGYPDSNSKDPILMKDARFFDIDVYMHRDAILDEMGDFMDDRLRKLLADWKPDATSDSSITRNQATDRSADSKDYRNGLLRVVKRMYKVSNKAAKYLVDAEGETEVRLDEETLASNPYAAAVHQDPAMMQALGLSIETQDEEWLWNCWLIPAVSEEDFFFNGKMDFQPVDVKTRKKLWPVTRLPHLYVGGKSIGAIQTIIKIQEYRNLMISALVHHIQTTANGALGYEDGAVTDPVELDKLLTKRNRGNISIKFAPMGADKRQAKDKIFTLPKGEFAFADGGPMIEEIFKELVQDLTGASQVLRGEAQQGSPASLYKQQTEQADNNMMGTTELYKEFQYGNADLLNNFIQQFFTEERIIEIEGPTSDPMQMILNQQTAMGIKNDVSRGLYSVRRVEAAPTEGARRQRLGDNLEIVEALVKAQLPNFLVDYESVIENMEIPEARKNFYLQNLQQWRMLNGIQAQAMATAGTAQAQADGSNAQAQAQVNNELMRTAAQPGQGAGAAGPAGARPAGPQASPAFAGANPQGQPA